MQLAASKDQSKIKHLISDICSSHPKTSFEESIHFRWSPEENTIYYNPESETVAISLLHEVGHMFCGHTSYSSDVGLLKMEVSAWDHARKLAKKYMIDIDEEHIEKCLDSYREWIYRRSSCPLCTQAGIESQTGVYSCINCYKKWRVTTAKFCRVYRKTVT
jgi:hypothetical protein